MTVSLHTETDRLGSCRQWGRKKRKVKEIKC